MQIRIKNITPIPLRDKIRSQKSDVWNNDVIFSSTDWIKIKAPSGTGKTTLIHYLYKLRNDFDGAIFYDKQDIKNISANDLALFRQEKISIIFQDLRLFENLTAYENIELNRVLQKPYYAVEVIEEMAQRLNIKNILHQPAGICSYGEQQRIAIMRALIQPFKILLMDEPFSHLDNENTRIAAVLIAEECTKREAGFVLTDLDDDNNFSYTKYLNL